MCVYNVSGVLYLQHVGGNGQVDTPTDFKPVCFVGHRNGDVGYIQPYDRKEYLLRIHSYIGFGENQRGASGNGWN